MTELNALVLGLWDFDDPAGSRERFVQGRAVLDTQVARSLGLSGDFAAGHELLDSIVDDSTEVQVRVALERGRLLRSGGDVDGSVPLFRKAYDIATGAGLSGLGADAAHMLAVVVPSAHEEWAQRGLSLAADSDDPLAQAMTGALLNNLGWNYADAERWDEAYELFDRAVAVRQKVMETVGGKGADTALHIARWTRARANRALGHRDVALAEMRELAATEIGAADPYVAEELERLTEGI